MVENKDKHLTVRVKTAKNRKISSVKWLTRHLNDPYVIQAKSSGYKSRAAFKLIEINDKFNLIKSSSVVIDLGAAPGGWTQIILEKINPKRGGKILSIDINDMDKIGDAIIIKHDFLAEDIDEIMYQYLKGEKVDLVMSDMAAPSCGHSSTDHIKIMALCEAAFIFAKANLKLGGNFIAKILKGGSEHNLLNNIKKDFTKVKHYKPDSSRSDSAESYIVAIGFRNGNLGTN